MSKQTIPVACGLALLGLGLAFVPASVTSRVRGLLLDTVHPGQKAVRVVEDSVREGLGDTLPLGDGDRKELLALREKLAEARSVNAALSVRLAQVNDTVLREQTMSQSLRRLPRLIVPSLVEANVLGKTLSEEWCAGRLLDQGESQGVREHSFVLSSKGALIDLGEDALLSPEDAVLLGRCVVGKVERVGRWTSTLLPVTDSRYRGRARLIREHEQGLVTGGSGILKGTGGAGCSLEGIDENETVQVGDGVYTTSDDTGLTTPFYYGHVTQANLPEGARHWKVTVEPASRADQLSRVTVLRMAVHADRVASREQGVGSATAKRPQEALP